MAQAVFREYQEVLDHRRASGTDRLERLSAAEAAHPILKEYRFGLVVAAEAIEQLAAES